MFVIDAKSSHCFRHCVFSVTKVLCIVADSSTFGYDSTYSQTVLDEYSACEKKRCLHSCKRLFVVLHLHIFLRLYKHLTSLEKISDSLIPSLAIFIPSFAIFVPSLAIFIPSLGMSNSYSFSGQLI